ncbi:MAG TPA: response regulator, partial [Chryseosolibacter sp.]
MDKMTVYLADDHALFRQAFARVIRDCERVGVIKEAKDGKALLAMMDVVIPDVVIVDIEMPA